MGFFPNIPNVPGVPAVGRTNTKVALLEPGNVFSAAVLRVPYLQGILQAASSEKWGLYDKQGLLALEPTTVVDINRSSSSKIARFPVESGSYANYNKVQESDEVIITMIKSGTYSELSDFISRLESIKKDLNLYDVVTPEKTILNINVESFDYPRTISDGVTLISFTISAVEIREVSQAFSGTTIPSIAKSVGRGKQQPQKPRTSLLFDTFGSLGG